MFSYPLPIPRFTFYEEFGLTPEATPDEIRDAVAGRRRELQAELVEVKTQLNAVYAALPALREVEAAVAKLQIEPSQGDPAVPDVRKREKELRDRRDELDRLERQALKINPQFWQLRDKARDLAHREEALNLLPLLNPEKRRAYDQAHPPMELLKVADCAQTELFDRAHSNAALSLLRQELAEFLTSQGEAVFHPSDLTRSDFSSDFERVVLLDGE